MGLLAAVRQWYKRDHDGEQRMWRGWMQTVETRLKPIKGLQFEYLEPAGSFQPGDAAAHPLGCRRSWASPAPNWRSA